MTIHVALLRGINVGGHKRVAMAELRELGEALGLASVHTLLQSGNLVFESGKKPASLERLLEDEAVKRLRLETAVFVRTAAEWDAIVTRNPFPAEAKRDPSHLLLMLLKDRPGTAAERTLQSAIPGSESLRVDGRAAYLVYPDGVGRSRLTNALIEKTLGTSGTARNWNTVLKLFALTRRP